MYNTFWWFGCLWKKDSGSVLWVGLHKHAGQQTCCIWKNYWIKLRKKKIRRLWHSNSHTPKELYLYRGTLEKVKNLTLLDYFHFKPYSVSWRAFPLACSHLATGWPRCEAWSLIGWPRCEVCLLIGCPRCQIYLLVGWPCQVKPTG